MNVCSAATGSAGGAIAGAAGSVSAISSAICRLCSPVPALVSLRRRTMLTRGVDGERRCSGGGDEVMLEESSSASMSVDMNAGKAIWRSGLHVLRLVFGFD